MSIPVHDLKALRLQAYALRKDIITMVSNAKSGHPGGALGMAELFTVLYHYHAHIQPDNPLWEQRDYILVSNGHTCPVWYAALASRGFFNKDELNNFRKINSLLQGHPHMPTTPGVENSGGPLGQGTSQAVGIAFGLQLKNNDRDVYCITSDGEHQEGQSWEAIMLAARYKLNNLIFIVDWNRIQIGGSTEPMIGDLEHKYQSFGWKTYTVDGHDITAIKQALDDARNHKESPAVLLAQTIPGKGVDFMENDYAWHGKAPNAEQTAQALEQLDKEIARIHNDL